MPLYKEYILFKSSSVKFNFTKVSLSLIIAVNNSLLYNAGFSLILQIKSFKDLPCIRSNSCGVSQPELDKFLYLESSLLNVIEEVTGL